jgi:hypothetical protein
MKIYHLPIDIQDKIYSYIDNYERRFNDVISYIKRPPLLKRFKKDVSRIRKEYTDFVILKENKYDVTILHQNNIYKLIIPPGYPFKQPILYFNNQRFSSFNDWSPALGLAGLIMCYYDNNCNIIVNNPYISDYKKIKFNI